MKKILVFCLLAALLVAAFAGCASAPAENPAPEQGSEPSPAPETPEQSEAPDAESPDESETPAQEPETSAPAEEPETAYEPVDVNVAVMKGPTGMGMAKLMQDAADGAAANNYAFSVSSDTSEVMGKVIAGEYDIAALPTNNAAMAYNKTEGGVQMLAINTLGTLYILQNTATQPELITSIDQLAGKTITTFGQGANPEYVLTYLLEQAGLTVGEDVTVDFKATVDEVLTLAAAGQADFVMVPEPNSTVVQTKNADFQVALDLNEAWEQTEGTLVMGCLVVSTSFATEHPEAVAKFLEEYEASVNYALENTEDAAVLCAAQQIVPSEAIALKSLPNCHLVFAAGSEMQPLVQGYYEVLYGYNPAAVGGAVPAESFYYVA